MPLLKQCMISLVSMAAAPADYQKSISIVLHPYSHMQQIISVKEQKETGHKQKVVTDESEHLYYFPTLLDSLKTTCEQKLIHSPHTSEKCFENEFPTIMESLALRVNEGQQTQNSSRSKTKNSQLHSFRSSKNSLEKDFLMKMENLAIPVHHGQKTQNPSYSISKKRFSTVHNDRTYNISEVPLCSKFSKKSASCELAKCLLEPTTAAKLAAGTDCDTKPVLNVSDANKSDLNVSPKTLQKCSKSESVENMKLQPDINHQQGCKVAEHCELPALRSPGYTSPLSRFGKVHSELPSPPCSFQQVAAAPQQNSPEENACATAATFSTIAEQLLASCLKQPCSVTPSRFMRKRFQSNSDAMSDSSSFGYSVRCEAVDTSTVQKDNRCINPYQETDNTQSLHNRFGNNVKMGPLQPLEHSRKLNRMPAYWKDYLDSLKTSNDVDNESPTLPASVLLQQSDGIPHVLDREINSCSQTDYKDNVSSVYIEDQNFLTMFYESQCTAPPVPYSVTTETLIMMTNKSLEKPKKHPRRCIRRGYYFRNC